MANETDIANMALMSIGAELIRGFENPKNKRERACAVAYPMAKENMFYSYAWSFLKVHREIALIDDNYSRRYRNLYAIPADCLVPMRVISKGFSDFAFVDSALPSNRMLAWSLVNEGIATNTSEAVLQYTLNDVQAGKHTPAFNMALAAEVAAYISPTIIGAITGNHKPHNEFKDEARIELARAQERDANVGGEYYPDEHGVDSWLNDYSGYTDEMYNDSYFLMLKGV